VLDETRARDALGAFGRPVVPGTTKLTAAFRLARRSARSSWINTDVADWLNEAGEYPARPPYERATRGAVDIGLFRHDEEFGEFGGVILDLPTGELLGFRFEECC
jgi:hypothetical protein